MPTTQRRFDSGFFRLLIIFMGVTKMPQDEKEQGGTATLQDHVEVNKEEEIKGEDSVKEKEEHKNEPPVGSKRWNEIYYEAKEAKRRNEELQKDLEAMRKHNSEIMEIFKTSNAPDSPQNIKKELQDLRAQKRGFIKNGDHEKVADIEDKIEDIREKMYETTLKRETIKEDEVRAIVKKEVLSVKADNVFDDFEAKTEWFSPASAEYDEEMAATALGLDLKLSKTFEGSDKERLQEVKKRVEARFGYKRKNRTSPTVERVGGEEKGKEVIGVELTSDELHIARNLFPNDPDANKKYFAQKQLILSKRKKG